MKRITRRFAVVLTAMSLLIGGAAAAQAAYTYTTGTLSARTYMGAKGVSGVYKVYTYKLGTQTICMVSSSASNVDPIDSSNFSRIIVNQGGAAAFGGYATPKNGDKVRVDINTGSSPLLCGGAPLAYLVQIDR